jgi:hypothetical protein
MRLAVSGWLGDLASSLCKPDDSEADQMLVDSGLYELMKNGTVIDEAAP